MTVENRRRASQASGARGAIDAWRHCRHISQPFLIVLVLARSSRRTAVGWRNVSGCGEMLDLGSGTTLTEAQHLSPPSLLSDRSGCLFQFFFFFSLHQESRTREFFAKFLNFLPWQITVDFLRCFRRFEKFS